MKENKYNDTTFFEKYSQMDRSKNGLDSAGEWSTLKKVLPDFKNKKVLDLGCGYGWHCIYAIDNGADTVIGVDISSKMLDVAKEKSIGKNIKYINSAIEDINLENNSFDIVISSLAFHYIKSFDDVVNKVNHLLKKDGEFIFSVEHPIFTAEGSQDWVYDDGKIKHFPLDNYFYEGARKANFLGEEIIKYHRTLTEYIGALLRNNFEITNVIEPTPPDDMIENIEGMKDELRRPMMLIISGKKK